MSILELNLDTTKCDSNGAVDYSIREVPHLDTTKCDSNIIKIVILIISIFNLDTTKCDSNLLQQKGIDPNLYLDTTKCDSNIGNTFGCL